jgi:hypothetical protein
MVPGVSIFTRGDGSGEGDGVTSCAKTATPENAAKTNTINNRSATVTVALRSPALHFILLARFMLDNIFAADIFDGIFRIFARFFPAENSRDGGFKSMAGGAKRPRDPSPNARFLNVFE